MLSMQYAWTHRQGLPEQERKSTPSADGSSGAIHTLYRGGKLSRGHASGQGQAPVHIEPDQLVDNDCEFVNTDELDLEEIISISRSQPRSDGVYIDGMMEGVETLITVDTGASRTLISKHLFDQIPQHRRPEVQRDQARRTIRTADGNTMRDHGTATVELSLAGLTVTGPFIIADISDDVLLGGDLLQKDPSGPADLLLSQGVMEF